MTPDARNTPDTIKDTKMIERFQKQAGDATMQGVEDPTMLLFGNPVPDNVTLPAELGGSIRTVDEAFVAPCPVTGATCRHLKLAGDFNGKTLYVAESSRFFWYSH